MQCAVCPSEAAVQWVKATPDGTETVAACVDHAIPLDAAAHLHTAECTAPAPDAPTPCCTPHVTAPEPADEPQRLTPLPPTWL